MIICVRWLRRHFSKRLMRWKGVLASAMMMKLTFLWILVTISSFLRLCGKHQVLLRCLSGYPQHATRHLDGRPHAFTTGSLAVEDPLFLLSCSWWRTYTARCCAGHTQKAGRASPWLWRRARILMLIQTERNDVNMPYGTSLSSHVHVIRSRVSRTI